jgi:CheY-like chemotaxis protein
MDAWDAFESELQEALRHLYDSRYLPPARLCACLSLACCDGDALRDALLAEIAGLRPPDGVPDDSPDSGLYDVLALRYLHNLTQEATAERLGMTPRHLRRKQREAVAILARRIWDRRPSADRSLDSTTGAGLADEWHAQVQDELRALESKASLEESDVAKVLRTLDNIAAALSQESGVQVRLGHTEPDMVVRMPAAALRQVLIAVLNRLLRGMTGGRIEITAHRRGPQIELLLDAAPAANCPPADSDLAAQILAQYGGQMRVQTEAERTRLLLELGPAGTLRVLVVDDNESLVHFYRRFVTGTRYVIEHMAQGGGLIEQAVALGPDLIVLDVMLPDVDGWELLTLLHASARTQQIPVLVCSVVKEHDLALSLGAIHCVSKPIGRQGFIAALDTAIARAAEGNAPPTANNAAAC